MSNANNSGFIGWMKKNPGMALGTVLFIVAMIVLIGWIVNRGSNGAAGPGVFVPGGETATKPVVSFGDSTIILKPDAASSKTSGYRMFEYATGAVSPANIDLTVTWTNGAGFTKNKVTSLVFRRFIGTREISEEPIKETDESAITDFGGGSVTFLGSALKTDETGVGENVIKVSYTVDGSTDEISLTSTSAITITQEQLDTTVDLTTITSLTVPVTTGSTLTASITENPEFTKYSIQHRDGGWVRNNLRMKVLADGKVQFSDVSGTAISLWSGSPTSFFISDYMGYQFIHDGAMDSDNYWVYPGDGDVLVSMSSDVIFKTESELRKALFTISTSPLTPETMYDRNIRNTTVTGYATTAYPYVDQDACNAKCLEDDTCDGVLFTDTAYSDVDDRACWKLARKPGEAVTYGPHTHYSASIKAPVKIYENPAFTGKNTVDVTGTPWSADGWDTFMSSTAHPVMYQSWHPFAHLSGESWASFTAENESVGIKYPKKVILKMYIINSISNNNNYTPGSVVVEGSNDGTAWADLKTTTTLAENVGYGKNRTRTIAYEDMSSNTTPYAYYRARIPRGGHFNNISDFKLFTTLP